MKRFNLTITLVCLAMAGAQMEVANAEDTKMVTLTESELKWVDVVLPGSDIPVLEKGAKVAVLQGVPGGSGPVVLRIKMPPNFTIAPHWHSSDEVVTVLLGTIYAGMGDIVDKEKSLAFPTGGFVVMPAKHHHFAWTKDETIIEIHAQNPFDIFYVNSADDPRKRKN